MTAPGLDPQTLTWTLVHLAAATQLAGYLFRDQIVMRWVLLAGNALYGAYYVLHPAPPLWDAAAWSLALVAANLAMIVVIARRRRHSRLDDDALRLFGAFGGMEPGDFRRLLALSHCETAAAAQTLTRRGAAPEHLYFIVSGALEIDREDGCFTVDRGGCFIGEIAFVLGGGAVATATVTVAPGARYYAWSAASLRTLMRRRETITHCLERAFNRDMALKLSERHGSGRARAV